MLVLYAFYAKYTTDRFQQVLVRGLYNVTTYNFRNISDNNNALITYPNTLYTEFSVLNQQVASLKTNLDNATFIAGNVDYSLIHLNYIDADKNLITFESFKNSIEDIIFASQNYRNVIIELFYESGEDNLTSLEVDYLLLLFKTHFADYTHVLYVLPENRKSIYLYLPRIDSLSKIREQLESTLKSI